MLGNNNGTWLSVVDLSICHDQNIYLTIGFSGILSIHAPDMPSRISSCGLTSCYVCLQVSLFKSIVHGSIYVHFFRIRDDKKRNKDNSHQAFGLDSTDQGWYEHQLKVGVIYKSHLTYSETPYLNSWCWSNQTICFYRSCTDYFQYIIMQLLNSWVFPISGGCIWNWLKNT